MKAKLVYRNKIITEDTITELVIWRLADKTSDRPHGLKYRLYHGSKTGECLIRYDNELGKGDHKHKGNQEFPYQFVSVEQLVEDFITDITKLSEREKKYDK